MDIREILSVVDHTLLATNATWEDIKKICDDGVKYQTASVCIPASFVKDAKEYVDGKVAICTVVGFPNGYSTTAGKVAETRQAIADGADEVDMVINVGMLKAGEYDYVLDEIRQIKAACGNLILKVIIETCLLTDEEKIKMCYKHLDYLLKIICVDMILQIVVNFIIENGMTEARIHLGVKEQKI